MRAGDFSNGEVPRGGGARTHPGPLLFRPARAFDWVRAITVRNCARQFVDSRLAKRAPAGCQSVRSLPAALACTAGFLAEA